MYHLFIQKGIDFISHDGFLCFITSNSFLKNKHNNKLRKYVIEHGALKKVILFYCQIFENASVDNTIFLIGSSSNKNDVINVNEIRQKPFIESLKNHENHYYQSAIVPPHFKFNFDSDNTVDQIIEDIEIDTWTIKEIGRAYFGIQTFDRSKYVSKERMNKTHFPVIDGGNIRRYKLIDISEYVDFQKLNIKSGGNAEVYDRERIVVRQIGDYPIGTICPPQIYTLNTVYNIFLHNDDISLRYVLSVINSKVLQFYWAKLFYDNKATFPKIKKDALESIRIKKIVKSQQLVFSKVVDYILLLKKSDDVISFFFENMVDLMIYELYFPKKVKLSNCEVLKHLNDLPDVNIFKDLNQQHKVIREVYQRFSRKENPISIAMFNMDTIDEIAIIEGKNKR